MNNPESVSALVIPLLKEFEGFRAKAYWDQKHWAIGYGTSKYPTGELVMEGDTCTQAQALAYADHDVRTVRLPYIVKRLKVSVSYHALAALISLAYNLGNAGLAHSRVFLKLNAGATRAEVAEEFAQYIHIGKNVAHGLMRRRASEAAVFLGEDSHNAIATFKSFARAFIALHQ